MIGKLCGKLYEACWIFCYTWLYITVLGKSPPQKELSSRFPTTSGVRQGCILAPALFCVATDWIIAHVVNRLGISVDSSQFPDLVYADNTALLVQSSTAAASYLSSFSEIVSTLDRLISWPNTKLNCEPKNIFLFLANVNSSSCSLYVVVRPSVVCRLSSVVCLSSVCRLSVTFVRPTQTIEIFGNVSTL